MAVLKSQGMIRKKGTAADIKRMFGGQKGVRTRVLPTPVDNQDD